MNTSVFLAKNSTILFKFNQAVKARAISVMAAKTKPAEDSAVMIDKQRIAYTVVGNGPHPVLFFPGSLGSYKTDFQTQLNVFDRDKFTLIGWDAPGYGYSRPPDRDFSGHFFRRDADMAHKLMQVLGFGDSYSLVGWSGGGVTALIVAAKYSAFVKRLVVFGANSFVTEEDVKLCENLGEVSKWPDQAKAQFLAMYGEEYFRNLWAGWLKKYKKFSIDSPDGSICKENLKDIQCPTLILHGSKDPIVLERHAQYLKKNIANSKLLLFPGGHNLHVKFTDKFNQIVQDFLQNPNMIESSL